VKGEPPTGPGAEERVRAACRGLSGRRLAFDLDGTLVDQAVVPDPATGAVRVLIQVRPGAEALVETLTPGCELLLYTAREASQVAQVLDRCPALRAAFLPHAAPDAPLSAAEVCESPACFTLADWLEVMDALLDRALDDAPALDDLDRRLLGLVRDYARDPASLLHLKLPELAARRGKRGFDVIVDDSPGLGDLLDRVGSDVGRIHLPEAGRYGDTDGLARGAHDALVQVAELLPDVGRGQVRHVEAVLPLTAEPVRRFAVTPDLPDGLEELMTRVDDKRQRWLAG